MGSSTNANTCVLCAGPLSATYHNGQHGSWVTWFCPMCDVQRTPTPTPPAPVAPSRGGEAVAWGVADCDGKIVDADVYRDRCEAWVGSTSPGAPFRVVALVPKEAP